jgi:uncharacterized repeat protein (TIGR01451 family)
VWLTVGAESDLADLLPQSVISLENQRPDVWVEKQGPETASPGDRVSYIVSFGNAGFADAGSVLVEDFLPEEVTGGDGYWPVGDLAEGAFDRRLATGTLQWGLAEGLEVVNTAVVTCADYELRTDNNAADCTTAIQVAHDPNAIHVSPEGGVDRDETLTYTVECENVGAGTAYGVYAAAYLDRQLDDYTLSLPDGMFYDPITRTIVWEVGTLPGGEGDSATFTVEVASNARRARPVMGQATVYFPSVPEETPTNVVYNIVNGSFPDVPWDHWALGQIESAYEGGIVQGYPDGTYQPTLSVSRDQMAVYIARALAGGEESVPTGPAEATFDDVPTDHWAYKYVEYAVANDIVHGYDPVTYAPDLVVDRGQMAVFIARAIATPTGDAGVPDTFLATFDDVTPENDWSWCHKYVEYIASRAITAGYTDGLYHPEIVCSRDQMAVYITRAFQLPM